MLHSVLPLFCLGLLNAAAAPAVPTEIPVAQYKAALKKHAVAVSIPMLKMLDSNRTGAIRQIVGNCRKSTTALDCTLTNSPKSCAIAASCVLQDHTEEKLIKASQDLTAKRYTAMTKFSDSFKKWRRRFIIGTMNRLADRHNSIAAEILAEQTTAVQKLMLECNKGPIEPTKDNVACIYDHFDKAFHETADSIDRRAALFKVYINSELMQHIDGFSDDPTKTTK